MRVTIIFILFCNSIIFCQNLVPNPGFEEINDTISRFTKDNVEFKRVVKNWTTPNIASPDLITPDFEEKYITPPPPHSGSNMVGIQFHEESWIECITVNLTKAVIPTRTYYVEYWIRKAYCINPKMNIDQVLDEHFGILFSSDSINNLNGEMLVGSPQVRIGSQKQVTYKEWVKVSNYYTPKAEYDKLYLGQFQEEGKTPTVKMGYYVIDDILVEELADIDFLDINMELPIGSKIPLNDIHFQTGTTKLQNQKSYSELKKLVNYLNSNLLLRIRINGHTDSKGNKKSNLILSRKRAKFVAQNILQQGISKDRIEWKGFGEEFPVATNENEEGRSKNRRVEFEIIK